MIIMIKFMHWSCYPSLSNFFFEELDCCYWYFLIETLICHFLIVYAFALHISQQHLLKKFSMNCVHECVLSIRVLVLSWIGLKIFFLSIFRYICTIKDSSLFITFFSLLLHHFRLWLSEFFNIWENIYNQSSWERVNFPINDVFFFLSLII
jgi:hypothetical protein